MIIVVVAVPQVLTDIMMDKLRFASFNCNGALKKLNIIADLCATSDVVFLQETWAMPRDLHIFDRIDSNFNSYAISSVDHGQILAGRTYGGLTVLWRKSIDHICRVITFDDDRLLGLKVDCPHSPLLGINVYLPYYCEENYDDYLFYIGKILSVVDELDNCGLMVLGDFNCTPGGDFYREWLNACGDYSLTFSDVERLPAQTFTHVNNYSLSKSWLDHCLSSETVNIAITDVKVDCNYSGSDHVPLLVEIGVQNMFREVSIESGSESIKWDFSDERKRDKFYNLLCRRMSENSDQFQFCMVEYCGVAEHRNALDARWDEFVRITLEIGEGVFGKARRKSYIKPGWNTYVREFYDESRRAFLNWRSAGSPRDGVIANIMRRKRAAFKLVLRQCERNEDAMRAEALAAKLRSGKATSFWGEVKRVSGCTRKLPQSVDHVSGDTNIAELWKLKYEGILNSVDDRVDKETLVERLGRMSREEVALTCPEEVCIAAGELSNSKSCGLDGIPAEVFKYAPVTVHRWFSGLVNMILTHSYVPCAISDVKILPILKNNTLNPSESANYRPVAISTSGSKILEKILFSRLEEFLGTTDNQFGFKAKHSTDMCIFALKETINYYRGLNTPVFVCFLDIKSAFDRVSHGKLFNKLIDRGTPYYLVEILRVWYHEQRLCVAWGSTKSSFFHMANGIRQGSLISPYLFNLYVDGLNGRLSTSRLGCHVRSMPSNNFSYADDLAILAPTATAINMLLEICQAFARENLIEFSPHKTVVLLVEPLKHRVKCKPNVYLNNQVLTYVSSFKYLGHIITDTFTDDDDIERERRNLSIRGNVLIRKFGYCSEEVKCFLFRSFCYQLYTCALWSRHKKSTLNRIKVCYNKILRRLMGLPPWCSARHMFVSLGVRSFQETHRYVAYSLFERISCSSNEVLSNINVSDAAVVSHIRANWNILLHAVR